MMQSDQGGGHFGMQQLDIHKEIDDHFMSIQSGSKELIVGLATLHARFSQSLLLRPYNSSSPKSSLPLSAPPLA
jgi:hypothetical protein